MAKLKDTPFKTVKVSIRNPEDQVDSIFVGGNNVVVDGEPQIKHYRIKPDAAVSIPSPFVDQLRKRSYVTKGKDDTTKTVPMYIVEEVSDNE